MEAIQLEKRRQDETLDKMSHSLDHLHSMAKSMKDELDTQTVIFNDVDTNIDGAQGKMDSVTKRVVSFLKKGRQRDWAAIILLIVILAVVLYFALR